LSAGARSHPFKQVAVQVPPAAPANPDQIEKARPLLRDIIALMEFDRYGDAEAYPIGKRIERGIESQRGSSRLARKSCRSRGDSRSQSPID
jgi:hypothetical protein